MGFVNSIPPLVGAEATLTLTLEDGSIVASGFVKSAECVRDGDMNSRGYGVPASLEMTIRFVCNGKPRNAAVILYDDDPALDAVRSVLTLFHGHTTKAAAK